MKKEKITYYILFFGFVLATVLASDLSSNSSSSFQSEPTRQNVSTYGYFASQADSLKRVDLLNRNQDDVPREEDNNSENDKSFINDLVERGLKSFDFTFPNIFDFL